MPKCSNCNKEFPTTNNGKCPLCGYQLAPYIPTPPVSNKPVSSASIGDWKGFQLETQKVTEKISPNSRVCNQAIHLEKWGRLVFVGSIIIAIALLISSVLTRMFTINSIIAFFSLIGGGYIVKIVVDGFAVMVESAYRNMS